MIRYAVYIYFFKCCTYIIYICIRIHCICTHGLNAYTVNNISSVSSSLACSSMNDVNHDV